MEVYSTRLYGRNVILPAPGIELGGAQKLTANATLTTDSNRYNYLDATAGAFAVVLPGSSSGIYEGFTVYLAENAGLSTPVTITAPGLLINGASSLIMNGAYRQRELRFNGSQYVIRAGVN